MTEAKARTMAEPERRSASNAEQVAHTRPAVERCLAWSGLVPLPAFLLLHVVNELRLSFATDVSEVLRREPGPLTQLVSVLLVWLPLTLHLGAALLLLLRGRMPARLPSDVPLSARVVSRLGAGLAFAFLIYHSHTFVSPVWLQRAAPEDAGFRLIAELSSTDAGVPLRGGAYLLGLLATVTHAGLGVHRGLLGEGLLPTAEKRRASARACAATAALLFCAAAAAVIRVASGVLVR
jgi:hypothetical protein